MIIDFKLFKYRWVKNIVPIGVVLGLGYIDFGSFYSLGYQEIYRHHSRNTAISLWVLLGFCQITVFIYWILIFYKGPGKSPKFNAFNIYQRNDENLISLPDYFLCDKYGYPSYCSVCGSIRVPRSFHSRDTNYCVLKFDHYCLWVGAVIGEANYLFFMKYSIWFLFYFVIMVIYMIIYTKSNVDRGTNDIDHNFIVLYVMCAFWILMLSTLILVHLRYICVNMTTLDDITVNQMKHYFRWKERNQGKRVRKRNIPRKEDGIRYVNIKRGNDRLVVQYHIKEVVYSMGFKRNWINLIYNHNKNQGEFTLKKSSYTNVMLFKSFLIFIIPFIDIFYVFRDKYKYDDNEVILSRPDSELAKYEYYTSAFNEEFKKYFNEKIDRRECYLPSYLQNISYSDNQYIDNHPTDKQIHPETNNDSSLTEVEDNELDNDSSSPPLVTSKDKDVL